MEASSPGKAPTAKVRSGTEITASARPNLSASAGSMRCAGSGRFMVRAMTASVSRSRYMLSTFAAATISTVPNRVSATVTGGRPWGASQSPIAVVKTTRAVMRGFASSSRSPAVPVTPRHRARQGRGRTPASSG